MKNEPGKPEIKIATVEDLKTDPVAACFKNMSRSVSQLVVMLEQVANGKDIPGTGELVKLFDAEIDVVVRTIKESNTVEFGPSGRGKKSHMVASTTVALLQHYLDRATVCLKTCRDHFTPEERALTEASMITHPPQAPRERVSDPQDIVESGEAEAAKVAGVAIGDIAFALAKAAFMCVPPDDDMETNLKHIADTRKTFVGIGQIVINDLIAAGQLDPVVHMAEASMAIVAVSREMFNSASKQRKAAIRKADDPKS